MANQEQKPLRGVCSLCRKTQGVYPNPYHTPGQQDDEGPLVVKDHQALTSQCEGAYHAPIALIAG